MRDLAFLVRFFHVVPPVPPMMTGTFAVVTLAAAAAIAGNTDRTAGVLVPVIFLQLLAASSGFALPARRGHYDLLLTRGQNRVLIAIVHWAASIAPGLASWLALATVELVATGGDAHSLFATGTCAAVFVVSTLPWAMSIGLPRFSGGIAWMLVVVTAATTFSPGVMGPWTAHSTRIEELAWPSWAFLIYPVGAIGQHLARAQLMAIAPAIVLALAAMTAACRW